MRLFVAVPVPSLPKDLFSRLRLDWPCARWSPPENLHITLKFLGEAPESAVPDIALAVAEAAAPVRMFPVSLLGLGYYSGETSQALWMGVEEGRGELAGLSARIEDAVARFGFKKESRAFKAHVTLGRLPGGLPPAPIPEEYASKTFGRFTVSRFLLMESRPSPSGPSVYRPLHDFRLLPSPA